MTWSHDISKAPRGKMIPQEQQRRVSDGSTKFVIVEQFVPDFIWAATKCGKVLKSYWLPVESKYRPVGRWSGLAAGEEPVAWQPFVVPAHPALAVEGEAV